MRKQELLYRFKQTSFFKSPIDIFYYRKCTGIFYCQNDVFPFGSAVICKLKYKHAINNWIKEKEGQPLRVLKMHEEHQQSLHLCLLLKDIKPKNDKQNNRSQIIDYFFFYRY